MQSTSQIPECQNWVESQWVQTELIIIDETLLRSPCAHAIIQETVYGDWSHS